MSKSEKFNWTLPRAIFWLQRALKHGESEEIEPDDEPGLLQFANGLRAEINEKSRELWHFVFTIVPAAERRESFSFPFLPWGICKAEGVPTGDLVWTTDPPLPGGCAEDEATYQNLLRQYLQPQWSDPCSEYYPDLLEDVDFDWGDAALSQAASEGRFLVGVDEDGDPSRIYVVRTTAEERRVRRRLRDVRELPLSEAYGYVNENYPDSIDWPHSYDDDVEGREAPPQRTIEERDIRMAFALAKSDPRWQGVYEGCRRSCKAYVRLLALAAFNPNLVAECPEDYGRLLREAEKPYRIPDWEALAQASTRAGLEAVLPPQTFADKVREIQEQERHKEAEHLRWQALREQYTPQEVLAMFYGVQERWQAGELSVEQYDAEVERIEDWLRIVCSWRTPGAHAVWKAFRRDSFPLACIVHGI